MQQTVPAEFRPRSAARRNTTLGNAPFMARGLGAVMAAMVDKAFV